MRRHAWAISLLLLVATGLVLVCALLISRKPGELELAGHVPPGVPHGTGDGERVWKQAERTRWWGKPLDPRQFWNNRAIWYDDSAQDEAQRHGRTYPPVPVHMTNLTAGFRNHSLSPHEERIGHPWDAGLDGGVVYPFHSTDSERDYWTWTLGTKLKPPAYLEALQLQELRGNRARILQEREPPPHTNASANLGQETIDGRRAQETGMPAEALTDDALFWAYVLAQRQEYARWQARWSQWAATGRQLPPGSGFFDNRWAGVALDRSLITTQLTTGQVRAANAWKVDYLKHLLRANVDRTYIDAYMKAWGIAPGEVFSTGQEGASSSVLSPNLSPEPPAAAPSGYETTGRLAAPVLCCCPVSGGCGSAPRWATMTLP